MFDYFAPHGIAAHFIVEQTKAMVGSSQLLLTDGRRDFMKEANKRRLWQMPDRFDLGGSGDRGGRETWCASRSPSLSGSLFPPLP